MPVETPVRRRWRVRHRPRLIPCLLALVAVLLVIKWIDPFAPGERPLPETPDWITVELLPLNEFSRPGTPLEEVNGIVIHYVGNPGTTAAQNHSFFTNLAQTGETYASSHFLVGLDGEVLQNVPLNEVAYCSNQRNDDTISIECCHPDDSGEFTSATYESLVSLTRWLMEEYGLDTSQVIRHYDVTGKLCPKAFVEHPEEYQFEIVLSDLASVPSDVGGIEAAVNEIKPAHLDYWFTYELAQLLAALRMGGGLWSIQAVTLPPMEEE